MSSDLTVTVKRKAEGEPDSNGDVIIASIWFVLYLFMVVGTLFVNQKGPAAILVAFAAVLGGWGILGWNRKKIADYVLKSRGPHMFSAKR